MDNSYINVTEERSKQLLSLDALDLSFLPITYQPCLKDNLVVLWRKKTFHPDKKDYFEFVIKSTCRENAGTAPQETTQTICYICNTVVPKAYVLEHVNSSKHISYQKIAEIGLERARKYKQLIGSDGMKSSSEYFCEHCVAVIYLSNRNEHEKSNTHKNFAALDTFLNHFASFYTNDEIGDIIDSQIFVAGRDDSNTDISLLKVNAKGSEEVNIERNDEFEIIPLKINNNNESTHSVLQEDLSAFESKLKGSKDLIHAIESCLDNTHEEVNNNVTRGDKYEKANVVNNLEQYIKHLKMYGTIKLHTIDTFSQDRLRIETADGSQLVVSTFNFHGVKRNGKYLQCKLCHCVVKNLANHKLDEKHMKVVAQPLDDKHCIRRLQGHLSHCVICNDVIDNTIVHTQFIRHVKKLERAQYPTGDIHEEPNSVNVSVDGPISSINTDKDIPNPHKSDINKTDDTKNNIDSNVHNKTCNVDTIKKINESQYFCLTCDAYMHVNNVEKHLSGTKHKSNSKSAVYYLMNRGENKFLTCKVCQTAVHYYTWAVEDHIASAGHVENYSNCLAINEIDKINDSFYCKPCGKRLIRMSELSHIEKQSHKIKLASYKIASIGENYNLKDIQKIVDLNVNNEKVSMKHNAEELIAADGITVNSEKYSTESYDEKEISSKQNVEVNNSNKEILNRKPDNEAKLHCGDARHGNEVSFVDNPLSSVAIKIHSEIAKHKTMDVLLTDVNSLLEELLKYFNRPPEIHSHLQLTDVENVLNCIVCANKVVIQETEKHTNSLKHIHNHRKLMTGNKLKLKKDKYVCYVCNVYVEIGKELRHIETVEHEKRIESLKNGDYVLISADNKKLIDKIYLDLKVMETESEVTKSKNTTFGDFIPKNEVANDITNVRHHYCDLIDNKKQLICVLCQEIVDNTEFQYRIHTNDINHAINYKKVMTYNQIFQIEEGFVCGFCECIVSGNEFVHISNEKHILSQRNDPKKNYCFTCKLSTIDLDLKEHVTSECHVKNIGGPSHFYCNICNLQLANSDTNIERHNEGFEHQNNASMIDENNVVLKKKKCICQVCETTFSRDGLDDHVSSLNHIMLLHQYYYQPTAEHCSDLQD